jgi:methylated-DNA-protein-cysteine methyltransferase related protein
MGSPAQARITSDVLAIVRQLPLGWVTTHGAIGRHLDVVPRHIAYILTMLDDATRDIVPWHRVVADGGAIGRHLRRDDQIARLRAEGIVVSPVGIVQDMAAIAVVDLAAPPSGVRRRPDSAGVAAPSDDKPSRSRGSKTHAAAAVGKPVPRSRP